MRTTTRTTTTLAGVLLVAAAMTTTAGPATAAPAAPGRFAIAHDAVVRGNASSVAGYGASLTRFTDPKQWTATASFKVPAVTCTDDTTSALLVQLFFGGTDAAGGGLGEGGYAVASCDGTTPSYDLNISAQGAASGGVDVPTAAGDSVTVAFAATTKSEVSRITDTTTGATGSQTGTGFQAVGGLQASVQGGDAHSIYPRFTTVTFTRVIGGGVALATLDPYSFTAVGSGGAVKIRVSPIAASGRSFVARFVGEFTPGA